MNAYTMFEVDWAISLQDGRKQQYLPFYFFANKTPEIGLRGPNLNYIRRPTKQIHPSSSSKLNDYFYRLWSETRAGRRTGVLAYIQYSYSNFVGREINQE